MGIESEILIPMNADHSSICKFESSDDHQYKQLKESFTSLSRKVKMCWKSDSRRVLHRLRHKVDTVPEYTKLPANPANEQPQ